MPTTQKQTLKKTVFQVLDNRLKRAEVELTLGAISLSLEPELSRQATKKEYLAIRAISNTSIDAFTYDFISKYASMVARPVKPSSVNRYVELWLARNKHKYN